MTSSDVAHEVPLKIRKAAAARLGLTLDSYDQLRAEGQKWCSGCRNWHSKTSFNADRTRGDGLSKWCRGYRSGYHSRTAGGSR